MASTTAAISDSEDGPEKEEMVMTHAQLSDSENDLVVPTTPTKLAICASRAGAATTPEKLCSEVVGRPCGTPNEHYGRVGGLLSGQRRHRGIRGGRKSNTLYHDEGRLKQELDGETLWQVVRVCQQVVSYHPQSSRVEPGSFLEVRQRFPDLTHDYRSG
jgi:hypothetical protein